MPARLRMPGVLTCVPRMLAACLAAYLAAHLAACGGGSGEGLDRSGRPLGPDGDIAGPLEASFQSIQDHVFTPVCTLCHAGSAAPVGLRLDASNSYQALVGVPSVEVGSVLRVAPGSPDDSYLIHKLEGHAAVGARMPLGGPYLDADTMGVIRAWITAGALQTAAGPSSASPTLPARVAMTPAALHAATADAPL